MSFAMRRAQCAAYYRCSRKGGMNVGLACRSYYLSSSSSDKRNSSSSSGTRFSVQAAIDTLRVQLRDAQSNQTSPSYELSVALNLKPGQNLSGILHLPHGSGKRVWLAALSRNIVLTSRALNIGARYGGGDELVEDIANEVIKPTNLHKVKYPHNFFRRVVASRDMEAVLCKEGRVADLLRKYNMTPCVEDFTLVHNNDFIDAVDKHRNGRLVKFATTPHGALKVVLGKVLVHDSKQIRDNFHYILERIYRLKPDDVDVGAYVRSIYIGISQIKPVELDLGQVLGPIEEAAKKPAAVRDDLALRIQRGVTTLQMEGRDWRSLGYIIRLGPGAFPR